MSKTGKQLSTATGDTSGRMKQEQRRMEQAQQHTVGVAESPQAGIPSGFSWEAALERVSVGQVVTLTLLVMLGALTLWFAWTSRFILFALIAAVMLHVGMKPAVDSLEARGIHRRIGVMIVYGVLIVVVGGIVGALIPMLSGQVQALVERIPEYYRLIHTFLLQSGIDLLILLGRTLPSTSNMQEVQEVVTQTAAAPPMSAASSIAILTETGKTIFFVLAGLGMAFYLTIDRDRILTLTLLRMRMESRESARELASELESKVGAFIRGQLILCAVVGALSLAAYLVIGLPYALALGALAFIFEAVPMIGPLLAAIPAVLVAATMGPDKLIWVLVAVSVIQVAENNILVPRVMDRTVGVNAVVSILAIITFSAMFGLLGAILAIPLAAMIQVLINRWLFAEADEPTPVEEKVASGAHPSRTQADILRLEAIDLAQDVRKQFRASSEKSADLTDAIEDLIELSAMDLYGLLENGGGSGSKVSTTKPDLARAGKDGAAIKVPLPADVTPHARSEAHLPGEHSA